MRLHTDTLTEQDVREAAALAGVRVLECTRRGSRSRVRALVVAFSGSGPYRTQWQGTMDHPAASWDEWGIVLGVLFDRDRRMIAGDRSGYHGAADYHWQTGFRFARHGLTTADGSPVILSPAQQHRRHVWTHDQAECVTGSYAVHRCACGAVRRFLIGGHTREEIGLEIPGRVTA